MFPNPLLMESLKRLAVNFPDLPVTVFTEGLGGAEQRIRDHTARLGLYSWRPVQDDLASEFLAAIAMVPVVARDHPLATVKGPLGRAVLEDHVQLVLTDRTQVTARFSGGVISRRIWRFADLGTRLEYLLAGFGWCNMPLHLVETHIDSGRLTRLNLAENNSWDPHPYGARPQPPPAAGGAHADGRPEGAPDDLPQNRAGADPPSLGRLLRNGPVLHQVVNHAGVGQG
jgi:DNA-binding transcriptional LysR family regulator